MHLSSLLAVLTGAMAVTAASDVFAAVRDVLYRRLDKHQLTCSSQCTPDKDCCFSTKGACQRQAYFWIEKYFECGQIKLCPELGVPNADCVSVSLMLLDIC